MKPARVVIFLIAFAAIGLAQQSGITPEALRTWLTYIASDDLEGRATFSEGLGLAAAYIAEQLKSAGVKPAGDHGTYFQRVEVLGVKSTNRSSVTVEVSGQKRTFKNLEGVRFASNVGGKRTVTFDKVQFVGYGLNLGPEHDDYRGIDVKGKAVLWLGTRGPKTDQQANRLLRARADYATQEMGAGATISPPTDPIVGQRGARGGGTPVAP